MHWPQHGNHFIHGGVWGSGGLLGGISSHFHYGSPVSDITSASPSWLKKIDWGSKGVSLCCCHHRWTYLIPGSNPHSFLPCCLPILPSPIVTRFWVDMHRCGLQCSSCSAKCNCLNWWTSWLVVVVWASCHSSFIFLLFLVTSSNNVNKINWSLSLCNLGQAQFYIAIRPWNKQTKGESI